MATLAAPRSPYCPFATPLEGRRIPVPGAGDSFEPGNDLTRIGWMLSRYSTPYQDTLYWFSHVQPGISQGGVQDDPMLNQPFDKTLGLVAREIVPDQQHP